MVDTKPSGSGSHASPRLVTPGFDPHTAEDFPSELARLLRERADDLVAEAVAMLSEARLEHYEAAGLPTVRQRLLALLKTTLSCLNAGKADSIIAHTTRVARERFEAGYDLLEVQTSINVMEEVLWRRILSLVAPAEVARALGLVSTLFGVGKDALARTYVSLAAGATTRPAAAKTE
jgi:hypothetical protein